MVWNQNRLVNLLKSFHTLVKVRVGFWNLDGKEIIGYPSGNSRFCTMIRSSPKGFSACKRCDEAAFRQATRLKGPHIYQCHAGLTEMLVPITAAGNYRLGYLMIGQVRQPADTNSRQWEDLCRKLGPLKLNTASLKSAWERLTVIKVDQIRAFANILESLAAYLWLDNYIRIQKEPLSGRIKAYIYKNLGKKLSLAGIAGEFGIGKTTLCAIIKRDYHVTVNGLIRAARIEQARFLLQSREQLVLEVAEQVGFPDYNYFIKVFREETGVPPLVFRKLCEKEYLRQNPALP
ncbi:MAG: PocR ligand-binding domain-containing protein [Treponema sp.]|nr:PocR ligand-binding domain-containing protein [Treponema sp.]